MNYFMFWMTNGSNRALLSALLLSATLCSFTFAAENLEKVDAKYSCSLYAMTIDSTEQVPMAFSQSDIGGTVFQTYSADLSKYNQAVKKVTVHMNTSGPGYFWINTGSGIIAAYIASEHRETWAYYSGTTFKMYCQTK